MGITGGHEHLPQTPDLQLLRKNHPRGFREWQRAHNLSPNAPFCLHFRTDAIELFYIACNHTNKKSSKTFKLLNKLIPHTDIVIVEGAVGPDPQIESGEGAHALEIARKYDKSTYGAERAANLYLTVITHKYSTEDLYGWVFLMLMRQFHDVGLTEESARADYAAYSPWYYEVLPTISFDPAAWFRRRYDRNWKYGKYLDYSSPRAGNGIGNIIGREIADMRNPTLLTNLYKYMSIRMPGHATTFAYVIGMGHTYCDLPVLEKTFGHPAIIL